MKVFNIIIPRDIKDALNFIHEPFGFNGNYISYTVNDEIFEDEKDEFAISKRKVDAWLIANGAEAPKNSDTDEGESVLIEWN